MIRPYEAADWDGVGRVCVQTGDSGGDATGMYANDDLLPAIYAYPYVVFEPDLAWVVVADSAEDDDTDGEVVGYILGTSNVTAFVEWWAGDWAPRFEELLPVDVGWTGADLEVRGRGEHPENQLNEIVRKYPGEFHIDLLPAAQGHGLGRTLIAIFAAALRDRGGCSVSPLVLGQPTRTPLRSTGILGLKSWDAKLRNLVRSSHTAWALR